MRCGLFRTVAFVTVCLLGYIVSAVEAECTASRLNLAPLTPPDRYTVPAFAASTTAANPIFVAATATQRLRLMIGRTGDIQFEAGAASSTGSPGAQTATAVPVESAHFQRIDSIAFVPAASADAVPMTSVVIADAGVIKYVQLRAGGAVVDLGLVNASSAGSTLAVAVGRDRTLVVADAAQGCVFSSTLLDDTAYSTNMTAAAAAMTLTSGRVIAGICGSPSAESPVATGGFVVANATRIGSPLGVALQSQGGDDTADVAIVATSPPNAQLLRVSHNGLLSALGPRPGELGLDRNASVTALSADGSLFTVGRGPACVAGAVRESNAELLSGPLVDPFIRAVCGSVRGFAALHPTRGSGGSVDEPTMEGVLAFASDGGFFGVGTGCVNGATTESASNDQIMLIAIVCFFALLVLVVGGTVIFKRIRQAHTAKQNPPPVTRHGKIPDAIIAGEPQYRQRDGSLAPAPDFGNKRTAPRFAPPPKRSGGDSEMTDLRGQ